MVKTTKNYKGSGMSKDDYFWRYEDQGPPSPTPEQIMAAKARAKAREMSTCEFVYEMIRAGIKGGIKIGKKGY